MIKNFNIFLNENNWYYIDDKLYILKSYINILKNSNEDYSLQINYFIILHNLLILEREFFDIIKLSNKEINKYLELEKLNNVEDVINKFNVLYDNNSQLRSNVETLDNIESIRQYLKKKPEIFKKLITK